MPVKMILESAINSIIVNSSLDSQVTQGIKWVLEIMVKIEITTAITRIDKTNSVLEELKMIVSVMILRIRVCVHSPKIETIFFENKQLLFFYKTEEKIRGIEIRIY